MRPFQVGWVAFQSDEVALGFGVLPICVPPFGWLHRLVFLPLPRPSSHGLTIIRTAISVNRVDVLRQHCGTGAVNLRSHYKRRPV